MRKLIMTALMTAVALPAAAIPTAVSAQSNAEVRHDRRDVREERRDVKQAVRSGNQRAVRQQTKEYQGARRELREDVNDRNHRWGRDEWQGNRTHNRTLYARGNWRAPFRYHSFNTGIRISPIYFRSSYYVNDPWRYRLPPVGPHQQYVRHYNDLLLVDLRRGYVVRVIRNFYI